MITQLASVTFTATEKTPFGLHKIRGRQTFSHVQVEGSAFASLLSETFHNGQLVTSWMQGEGDRKMIARYEHAFNFKFPFTADEQFYAAEEVAFNNGQF